MALWRIQQGGEFEIAGLLTTISLPYNRISMHGVKRSLLEIQAAAIGFPLFVAEVSEKTNLAYEEEILKQFAGLRSQGITHIIFGDIFLEDLRAYREQLMQKAGLIGIYPLWKEDTTGLARYFIAEKFRTITCCVNDAHLDESWCGKEFDARFIRDLPAGVDPCGENGEFHTFCFDGPIFRQPIPVEKKESIYRPLELRDADYKTETKGFWYCELDPA
jgi:uncharacterized protein (TIGR00290 family)